MSWFFELGNRYAQRSNWKDFALVKFCLFSMGLLVGSLLPSPRKKQIRIFAGFLFTATYIPLMSKVFKIAKEMLESES